VHQTPVVCAWCVRVVHAGIYDPAFIAANQEARADNIIKGSKQQQVSKGLCQASAARLVDLPAVPQVLLLVSGC